MVGVGRPEVKGTSEAELAPVKAGVPAVADSVGASVAMGFRTLYGVSVAFPCKIGPDELDLLINDMYDTVSNKHVGNDNLGGVDPDTALLINSDGQVSTIERLQRCAILQAGAVSNSAADDVVGQDAGNVLLSGVGQGGSNGGEGLVGRREDGKVRGLIDGADEVCGIEGAIEGCEVGSEGGLGGAHGEGENGVDDVDYTTGEVDVLVDVVLVLDVYFYVLVSLFWRVHGKDDIQRWSQ